MIHGLEAASFDTAAFDDDFFKDYEAELACSDFSAQALAVLQHILTVDQADGSQKSYEQIRDESQRFFAHDWVRNDEAIMNQMAAAFAQACLAHAHGVELAGDSQLISMFETGPRSAFGDSHDDHGGDGHKAKRGNGGHNYNDYETDPKTGKKTKKKKRQLGWLILLTG